MSSSSQEVLMRVQATPNPNAWKFLLDRPVLTEGKATYSTPDEAYGNRLALDLLAIDGVKQVHFFQNVITITHRIDSDPDEIQKQVASVIQTRLPVHDPSFGAAKSLKELRKSLPEEIQAIEEILDRTVRPGLQGDGGDIQVLKYEAGKVYVHYEGACGTCPSSMTGTLMAIESILKDELNQELEVIPV